MIYSASDLSNPFKAPRKKIRVLTSRNIHYFNGRFNIISALRSPFKLIISNCSHRHRSELIVHRGSIVEVIIPENCFTMFHFGCVHCGIPSWFVSRGGYSSNTRAFLQS